MMFLRGPTLKLFLGWATLIGGSQVPFQDVLDEARTLAPVAPATFTHPGVLVDRKQLDFVKAKVSAGAQPWTDAYNKMLSSDLASLTRPAKPRATVVGMIELHRSCH